MVPLLRVRPAIAGWSLVLFAPFFAYEGSEIASIELRFHIWIFI